MAFSVRNANLDDLDILVSFTVAEAKEAECIEKSTSIVKRGIKAGIENPVLARYWVLEHDQKNVIGRISIVKEWSDWNAGSYWWIQSMYIQPEFRGQKLMRPLLEAVKEAAREEKALEIRLYVFKKNSRAINAYHREGFTDTPYQIMTMEL
jgi:GNAT superfamily N-acetyltransferase